MLFFTLAILFYNHFIDSNIWVFVIIALFDNSLVITDFR